MKRARGDLRNRRERHRLEATQRLLIVAKAIVADSKATQAVGFDVERWFTRWLALPQPRWEEEHRTNYCELKAEKLQYDESWGDPQRCLPMTESRTPGDPHTLNIRLASVKRSQK